MSERLSDSPLPATAGTERLLGQFKTPGGKLFVAEFAIRDGQLADVRVSGDFFLYPESLFGVLNMALSGAEVSASAGELEARVRAALPADGELLGFSPSGVAAAVLAGLGRANTPAASADAVDPPRRDLRVWRDRWAATRWAIIPETPRPPAENVALDEAVLAACQTGQRGPTLRFWGWSSPAVIIGRFQSVANEVHLDEAARRSVGLVRRMTGGGAMFLQPSGAVTYSLYLPEALMAGLSLRESYRLADEWVVAVLRDLGVPAEHQPINDITGPHGKIGGAAQARRTGWVLHHTTLAYVMDPDEMLAVLRIGRVKLSDKGTTSAGKRVGPLASVCDRSRDEIVAALHRGFAERFPSSEEELSEEEQRAAAALVANKYATPEWTFDVP